MGWASPPDILPRGPRLGLFCAFTPRPSHNPHDNRLCPHTPVHPSLALSCTLSTGGRLRLAQIGFVSHVSPRAEPRTTRRRYLPIYPSPPRFGFVLRGFRRRPPAPRPNWVRFARFPLGPRQAPHDGLAYIPRSPQVWLCSAHLPPDRGEIGFVWRTLPLASAYSHRLPIRNPQSSIRNRRAPGPQIGFVLHTSPSARRKR
jgi:hypothetical protein